MNHDDGERGASPASEESKQGDPSTPTPTGRPPGPDGQPAASCRARGATATATFSPNGGRYVLNGPLVLEPNVTLRGVGPDTVLEAGPLFLQRRGPAGGHPILSTNGAPNVTLEGFTADQSGDVLDGNGEERLSEYLVDVRGSKNVVVRNVSTRNPFTYSIAIVDSTDFCVERCNTLVASSGRYDQLDGIHVLNSSHGDVLANKVDQRTGNDGDDGLVAHTIDGNVEDVVYANNDVRGGSHGAAMQLAVTGGSIKNVVVRNNTFWGSPAGIHDGIYGNVPGLVDAITVNGNTFRDNDDDAVIFEKVSNVSVTKNRACRSGTFVVANGAGNIVTDNTTACP